MFLTNFRGVLFLNSSKAQLRSLKYNQTLHSRKNVNISIVLNEACTLEKPQLFEFYHFAAHVNNSRIFCYSSSPNKFLPKRNRSNIFANNRNWIIGNGFEQFIWSYFNFSFMEDIKMSQKFCYIFVMWSTIQQPRMLLQRLLWWRTTMVWFWSHLKLIDCILSDLPWSFGIHGFRPTWLYMTIHVLEIRAKFLDSCG